MKVRTHHDLLTGRTCP